MSDKELKQMDKEQLLGIIKAQRYEIERLQEDIGNYVNIVLHDRKEIDRLHSIIKEVREYIEHENFKRNILLGFSEKKYTRDILNKVLEILEKENK